MNNMLTYEECCEIVKNNDFNKFYEIKVELDGYNISIFNYRFAQYNDFIKPLENSDIIANEMRGLTFIFDKDGSIFDRFIMLHKFWNINQVSETMIDKLENLKIRSVMSKEDGSLISFIRLPNNNVYARTKMSFISDQAVASNRIYKNNKSIKKLVDYYLNRDIVLFFEYVSPNNKIVLDYVKEELILIKARNNKTGDYIDISKLNVKDVRIAESYDYSLPEMTDMVDNVEGIEGWVIEFEKNLMVKYKTLWYFDRHRLFTDMLNRENDIIKLILEDDIDDIISQLTFSEVDISKREYVSKLIEVVNKERSDRMLGVEKLKLDYINDKQFAIKYRNNPLFSIAISNINGKDLDELISDKIRKETMKLVKARKWINDRL